MLRVLDSITSTPAFVRASASTSRRLSTHRYNPARSVVVMAASAPCRKFLIKRSIPGVEKMTIPELNAASCASCATNRECGGKCTWITSYVVNGGTYCIYAAPDEAAVKEHAEKSGFGFVSIEEILGNLDTAGAHMRDPTCNA